MMEALTFDIVPMSSRALHGAPIPHYQRKDLLREAETPTSSQIICGNNLMRVWFVYITCLIALKADNGAQGQV